jgi:hypothetical protein
MWLSESHIGIRTTQGETQREEVQGLAAQFNRGGVDGYIVRAGHYG